MSEASRKLRGLLALVICVGLAACSESTKPKAPLAKDGVLDLSDWDFEQDGPVQLNGEWQITLAQQSCASHSFGLIISYYRLAA